MNTAEPARLVWYKSSYSGNEGGECLEVAADVTTVRIRDSKKRGDSPQLAFTRGAWAGFVADLGRAGF
ncbi:DUF397 domain-containing protein [Streptomyces sp. NPDC006997]|uniref:DUF397 domain-containing protein n=1 Tax=Streptomyces sp. NPDC006997 TaxID=3155356 RepID=UPI0033FF22F8